MSASYDKEVVRAQIQSLSEAAAAKVAQRLANDRATLGLNP